MNFITTEESCLQHSEMCSINFLNKHFSKASALSCLFHIHQQTPLQACSSLKQLVFSSSSKPSFNCSMGDFFYCTNEFRFETALKYFHNVASITLHEMLEVFMFKCCHKFEGKSGIIFLPLVKFTPF